MIVTSLWKVDVLPLGCLKLRERTVGGLIEDEEKIKNGRL